MEHKTAAAGWNSSPFCSMPDSCSGVRKHFLQSGEQAVYEIVIDGLSTRSVAKAMKVGLDTVKTKPGVLRVSAGNYGGKLGPHHFHLHRLDDPRCGVKDS